MAETKTVNLEVNSNLAKTEQAVTSLKSELRKAQAEVTSLSDKFGATSREAIEAAKRAADLKDRIGDAKAMTDSFNPDAKFKALAGAANIAAGALSGFEGAMGLLGVQSEQAQQAILKVQSALALSQGLNALQEIPDTFRNIKAVAIDTFTGIKGAIAATGIGLLVVALGAVYTYWDDIKEAVSGVSSEQLKLNESAQQNVDLQNEKLKSLNDQDNILKLQGKTEKQILQYKIAQTDEAINAQNILINTQIESNKQALEGTKRNKGLLQSMLDFINKPLEFLWRYSSKFINGTLKILNKIPGVKVDIGLNEDMLDEFNEKANELTSNYVFDEKETKAEGDKVLKAQQQALAKLKNDRAGYQLAIKDIDKKASDDAKLTEDEKNKKLKELNDNYNKKLAEEQTEFDLTDLQKKQDELNADAKFKEDQLAAEQAYQLKIAELQYNSEYEREEREEAARQRKLERAKEISDALISVASNLANGLDGIESLGNQKSKAAASIKKGIALVDLGISTATALGSAVKEARAAGAAAQAIFPTVPGVGIAASIASYASSAGMVFGNIAKAKQILSSAGSGGGASSSGGGGGGVTGGGMSAPAAPQFNVVGNSGVNQLAETMQGRSAQAPIQAYVVAQNVTTAQSLNRNIVSNASLG